MKFLGRHFKLLAVLAFVASLGIGLYLLAVNSETVWVWWNTPAGKRLVRIKLSGEACAPGYALPGDHIDIILRESLGENAWKRSILTDYYVVHAENVEIQKTPMSLLGSIKEWVSHRGPPPRLYITTEAVWVVLAPEDEARLSKARASGFVDVVLRKPATIVAVPDVTNRD